MIIIAYFNIFIYVFFIFIIYFLRIIIDLKENT